VLDLTERKAAEETLLIDEGATVGCARSMRLASLIPSMRIISLWASSFFQAQKSGSS
jgi:hypothetical protein